MEPPNENWLALAVKKLKAQGVIEQDKDVADRTGYSAGSVSNMLSGRSEISHKFKVKFEKVFGTFEEIMGTAPEDTGSPHTLNLSRKYIQALEAQIEVQKKYITLLEQGGKKE